MTPSATILRDCATAFKEVRRTVNGAAKMLWEISEKELWKGQFQSFGEYLERECQISSSFAAKLVRVYGHYVLDNRASERQIEAIDAEKLYLASRLQLPFDQQLIRASSWSRQELRAELASGGNSECTHPSKIEICTKCHARV